MEDIIVIGAGPAGLFTGFYGGMRNAKIKIIESLPYIGGQVQALYPEKEIYDVAGLPKITGQNLIDNLKEQLTLFETEIILNETIQTLEKQFDGSFKLTSVSGQEYFTKVVIITAGNGFFEPRKIKCVNSDRFEDIFLNYYINDLNIYQGKDVAILGGGDSAVDWSLMLEPLAKSVSIIHRRNEFRAHEHSVSKLKESNVKIYTPYIPEEIVGNEKIESIVIKETRGDREHIIPVDYVICNYGFISKLGPIENWGLEINKNSIQVNQKMETNIPGIYAVGDINIFEGKVKLIATGFGEAPVAINNAIQYINPKARIQPKHSTAMF